MRQARRAVRMLSTAALLACATSLQAQSTFSLATSYAYTVQRDERASSLTYSGGLLGAQLTWTNVRPGATLRVEADGAYGVLSSRITDDDRSVETSSAAAIRTAWARPLRGSPSWRLGAGLAAAAGVRVHRYTSSDGGFGELLVTAGPWVEHTRALGAGTLRSELGISALALLVRPYSDARIARDGDIHARAGFTHEIAAAHARATWQPGRSVLVTYQLAVQRADGADHYGAITHSIGLGFILRRR